jgi:hypothetical protein
MIALQVVREIPNKRNNSRCGLSKCCVMAGLVPAMHEDVRIESAISALGGRKVSSTSNQNRLQINLSFPLASV